MVFNHSSNFKSDLTHGFFLVIVRTIQNIGQFVNLAMHGYRTLNQNVRTINERLTNTFDI